MNPTVNKNRVIYESFEMFDVSGDLICYCNSRKAKYYIHKAKIALWIDSYGNFIQPEDLDENSSFPDGLDYYKGKPLYRFKLIKKTNRKNNQYRNFSDNDMKLFYLQRFSNVCVCCGTTEYLTKHHVVPYMFRKYFHSKFKNNNHHDVLPVCYNCHQKYELVADELKEKLANKYQLDFRKGKVSAVENYNFKILKARDTINKAFNFDNNGNSILSIPVERLEEILKIAKLKPIVLNQYADDIIERYSKPCQTTSEIVIRSISKINKFVKEYKNVYPNIRKIYKYDSFADYMDYLYENEYFLVIDKIENELYKFIFMWRKHFIDNAKPEYMPKYWKVDGKY